MDVFDLLERHEGLRLKPYCDRCGTELIPRPGSYICSCDPFDQKTGNITIGIGRNLSADGIVAYEARVLLGKDVTFARAHLTNWGFFNNLDEVRQAACIDLCCNVGRAGFDEFRDLIADLQAGEYQDAAASLRNSLADHEEPRRIDELATMLETGQWPAGAF